MDARHKVRVELGRLGHNCRTWLDDHEISTCVRGVTIEAHVDSLSIIKLELVCEAEVRGEAGVLVIDKPRRTPRLQPLPPALIADRITDRIR